MIEPIVHQIWHPFAAPEQPRDWQRFAESWRRWHPGHRYVLWGPEESRQFVADHHPDFLATYDAYRDPIQRVDALRVLILQQLGGIYADLDLECLRSVEPLLEGRDVVLCAEPPMNALSRGQDPGRAALSTVFAASRAGHPFWADVKEELKRSAGREGVRESTGAALLTRAWERARLGPEVAVAPASAFSPFAERACAEGGAFDLEYWVTSARDAYGVHHWAQSWKGLREDRFARRPYIDGLPARLRHPALHQDRPGKLVDQGPLVSCLMVSRGWREPARWSIDCFRNQSYANRELVVVTDAPSGDLAAYLEELGDPRIRLATVPRALSLGGLRNVAVSQARGELLATWDDDDLSGADRLAACVTALVGAGAAAAFVQRITAWWPARREVTISHRRPWESTLLVRREALPRFPERSRGEEVEVVRTLVESSPVVLVDDPNLYVNVVSGDDALVPERLDRLFAAPTFRVSALEYPSALTVLGKHVPIHDYLEWLKRRDPRTFDPAPRAAARQVQAAEAAAPSRPGASRLPQLEPIRAGAGGPLRFLFAWELGGGIGHMVRLSLLARPLLEAGHEVHLVLRDLSTVRSGVGELAQHPGLRLWQAPTWPAALHNAALPASYAELLFSAGFLDPARLNGLVMSWESLLELLDPDLLLADHAPTALLAARRHRCARALAGAGFFDPPPGAPMPTFRDWEPVPRARLEQSEGRALATCNELLAARALPVMRTLHELVEADESFLLTVPELDHFEQRARDPAQRYWGSLPAAGHGAPAHWPPGTAPAVFVYVKGQYGPIEQVLAALRASPWRVLAFIPGCPPALAAATASPRCSIVTEPVDMVEVCHAADAVVCNSGAGTVATALHAGKPLVMLPMHVEQFLVARRVQSLGAGLTVLEDHVERLAGALGQVVEQPAFREAALAFSRRYASPGGNDAARRVALRCEELAREARARRASAASSAGA